MHLSVKGFSTRAGVAFVGCDVIKELRIGKPCRVLVRSTFADEIIDWVMAYSQRHGIMLPRVLIPSAALLPMSFEVDP